MGFEDIQDMRLLRPPGLQWLARESAGGGVEPPAPLALPARAHVSRANQPPSGAPQHKANSGPVSPSAPCPGPSSSCYGVIFLSAPSIAAKGLFFHAVRPAGDAPERGTRKTPRCIVSTPCGPVTNLCDFYIKTAQWARVPPTGYEVCKVCKARSRGPPRPPPGPPPPGLVEDRRRRSCNNVDGNL